LFGLFCLRPYCIALAASAPFLARNSIGSGPCPAACGEPRACIFPDIYKLALQRTRQQRSATLDGMQRIARPTGRSIACAPEAQRGSRASRTIAEFGSTARDRTLGAVTKIVGIS
jgi:hypothetical protein